MVYVTGLEEKATYTRFISGEHAGHFMELIDMISIANTNCSNNYLIIFYCKTCKKRVEHFVVYPKEDQDGRRASDILF